MSSEWARLVATIIVLAVSWGLSRLSQAYFNRKPASAIEARHYREKLVWTKNAVWALGAAAVVAVWASKIAGFALSLAALAGATLLVSKELVMCVLGYLLATFTRPYRVGDFVEVAGNAGRVLDIDLFCTTLEEASAANQLTGKTVSFPNSLLLSSAVRNTSATGAYILNLYRIVVPFDVDLELAEKTLLEAADAATAQWREDAEQHFKALESQELLRLPSAKPRVLWSAGDGKHHVLSVRYACPVEQRLNTEQAIFRSFWSACPVRKRAGDASD